MFRSKNKQFIEEYEDFINICDKGIKAFDKAMRYYLEHGIDGELSFLSEEVKRYEDQADKSVYAINELLYGNFLLPEAREDITKLVDGLDDIIDDAEHLMRFIQTRNLSPIKELHENYIELLLSVVQAFEKTKEAGLLIFGKHKIKEVSSVVEEVGEEESICDRIEEQIVTKIFELELEGITPMLQSKFAERFSGIADSCEDTAQIIKIINLKRVI